MYFGIVRLFPVSEEMLSGMKAQNRGWDWIQTLGWNPA